MASSDFIFGWSFPLFRVFGIAVRVHWIFAAWVALQVYNSQAPWQTVLGVYGILFASVLLHEFGHSLACRSVGGKADRILLWPLGGLAECDPPADPWASLWTTICGPAVNLLLMAAAALVLHLHGPDQAILAKVAESLPGGLPEAREFVKFPVSLNPFDMLPSWRQGDGREIEYIGFYGEVGHWMGRVYLYNFVLFVFNMAFPCYPMDCGRVVQEILWLFVGYARSLWIALHIGLVMAVVMIVMGFTKTLHFGTIHIVFGVLCLTWNLPKRSQLAALRDRYGSWSAIPDPRWEAKVGGWLGRWFPRHPLNPKIPEEASWVENPADQAEIDRILQKVSAHGMASLTPEEIATLKGASGR